MEHLSAVAIVVGLVESLEDTLRVLQRYASRLADDSPGRNFERLKADLYSSYRSLGEVRGNLQTNRLYSQLDELMDTVQSIDLRLDDLKEGIQDVQRQWPMFFVRRKVNALSSSDIKIALSSIVIAEDIVSVIRSVQDQNARRQKLLNNRR